jgi:hypothetical protein
MLLIKTSSVYMEFYRETPCIANRVFFFFFPKTENKRAKQVLSEGLIPVGGGRI